MTQFKQGGAHHLGPHKGMAQGPQHIVNRIVPRGPGAQAQTSQHGQRQTPITGGPKAGSGPMSGPGC